MSLRSPILTAYDSSDGKMLWMKRIGGQISASPVSYDGLAFFVAETGETIVVDPAAPEKVIATNRLGADKGALFRASITPFDGHLFIRSDQALYCVGKSKTRPTE